jgi:hypothetical protein
MSLFDFRQGVAAGFLREKRGLEFNVFSTFELPAVFDLKADSKSVFVDKDGYRFLVDGEDRYFLFVYKRLFFTESYRPDALPRFHVVQCETIKSYRGFVSANRMPVPVTSVETGETSFQTLSLCGNCRNEIASGLFGKSGNWFDLVLNYFEMQEMPLFRSDAYHTSWKQISEAYKESVGWKCEENDCRIDLSGNENRRWLHTHHVDGNKQNNLRVNFRALCLLCHALQHKDKLVNRDGFNEVDEFVDKFRSNLSSEKVKIYLRLHGSR